MRATPLHDRLVASGAAFGEVSGWERPGWFLPEAARARGETAEYRYGWGRQPWFAHAAAEHAAVRTGVGLLDLSTFGKIRVEGRDALDVLQLVCANDVAVAPGRIVYTQWLNRNGGVEADVTVSRLAEHCVPGRHVDGEPGAGPRLAEASHPRTTPIAWRPM